MAAHRPHQPPSGRSRSVSVVGRSVIEPSAMSGLRSSVTLCAIDGHSVFVHGPRSPGPACGAQDWRETPVDHRLAAETLISRTRVRRPPPWTARNRPTHLADLVEAAAARHADHPALIDARDRRHAHLGRARRHGVRGGAPARGRRGRGRRPGRDPLRARARPRRRGARCAAGGRGGGARGAGRRRAPVVAHCAPRLLVDDAAGSVPADGRRRRTARPRRPRRARCAAVGGGEDLALLALHLRTRAPSACRTARVLANRAQAAALRPAPVTPVDRVLLAQPLFHAYGLAAGLFQVCWAGATAVLPGPGRPDAEELADTVARHRVSGLAGVPSTYRALLDLPPERLRTALAGLRLCTCGGVPLPRPWAAAFQEATGHRIVEGYGLTEAGPVVTSTPIDGVAVAGLGGAPAAGDRAAARGPRRPAADAAAGAVAAAADGSGARGGARRRAGGRGGPGTGGQRVDAAGGSEPEPAAPDPERPASARRRRHPAPVRPTSAPPRAASRRTSGRWRSGASRSSAPWPSAPPPRSARPPSAPPPRSGPPCGPATRSAT